MGRLAVPRKRATLNAALGLVAVVMSGCSGCEPVVTQHTRELRVTQSPDPAIAGELVTLSFDGTHFGNAGVLYSENCPTRLDRLELGEGRQLGFSPLGTGAAETIAGRQQCVVRLSVQATYPAGTPGTTRTVQGRIGFRREDTRRSIFGDREHVNRLESAFPVRVLTPADETSQEAMPPVASIHQEPTSPARGAQVSFDGRPSFDVDGDIVRYDWDLDLEPEDLGGPSQGVPGFAVAQYNVYGERTVTLTVTDDEGLTDTASVTFTVRNEGGGGGVCQYMCRAEASGRARGRLTPVRLRLRTRLVSRGRVSADILGRRAEGVLVRGSMTGRLARRARVPSALFDLYRSTFAGRFDFDQVVSRRDAPLVGNGLLLARSRRDRSTEVCLRVVGDGRRENIRRNRFRILGGTGDARRLHGTGTFPLPREANFRGRFAVRAWSGSARGLPRACRALRRHLPRRR